MYKCFFKRFLDVVLSFIGIVIFGIPMIIIAIKIKKDSKGPVFFKQERCGIHRKPFKIIKFRSMPVETPKDLPTDQFNAEDTLSDFQKKLRKSSLDELPQIFNIFKGEMSIIGPRPALFNQEYLLKLRDENGSNDIKPGMTGWAQINGRDELSDDVKAKYDGEYAKNINFSFDLKCFFGSFISVAKSDGVQEGGPDKRKEEVS